jgi:putative peptide zinc metalloprotease protein
LRPGDVVIPGTVLARLENLDLELEIARLAGQAAEQRAELAALRQERFHNTQAALRIPELAKSLAALDELLAEKRGEFARLTLRSSRAGVVLPPFETPPARETALGDLPSWSGLPTDVENRGAALTEGTLVCQVGDPHCWQALVVVDQTDVNLLSVGQTVEIRFDEMPNVVVEAQVDEIARRELAESPRHLSNKVGGELATRTDDAGVERPLSAAYQVRVVLYDPRALLRIGLRGTARIHVPAEPLAARAARWMSRTFHFQL